MAVRASAYRAIGGFRPLPFAEDATLLDDAARAGFRVRRDGAMLVETSSRRHGRAPQGLASALRAADVGEVPRVAHPAQMAWQWREHAAMRFGFPTIDHGRTCATLGARLGLSDDHVRGVARDCPNAEAFAMRIVPAAPGAADLVTLDEAEDALARLEASWCEAAA
ncbi:glycosyltransferase [Sphingomonas taxi]|uniref:Glycosyltransferase n=1 Tax=Sphingomonas taxi TaxID=1549858 RepID=A0A097EL92_9SPHN|nr:glycosyltransferase [Sphingomonas taxi]